jgi:hypothetical protein
LAIGGLAIHLHQWAKKEFGEIGNSRAGRNPGACHFFFLVAQYHGIALAVA